MAHLRSKQHLEATASLTKQVCVCVCCVHVCPHVCVFVYAHVCVCVYCGYA